MPDTQLGTRGVSADIENETNKNKIRNKKNTNCQESRDGQAQRGLFFFVSASPTACLAHDGMDAPALGSSVSTGRLSNGRRMSIHTFSFFKKPP